MIAANTSNPWENPAASAWPEMLTWAELAACAALLAVFTTTVQATVPRIASPIEPPHHLAGVDKAGGQARVGVVHPGQGGQGSAA